MIVKTIRHTMTMAAMREAEIQMGLNTHHHDQSMMCASLRTINAIVRSPTKPIPPLALALEEELDIGLFLF